jgi:hypothetical protein
VDPKASVGVADADRASGEKLLDGSLTDLLAALTSPAPRSRELRQNNPFAGVLADEERHKVLQVAAR